MHKFISRLCIDVIRDLLQQNNLFKIVFVYTIGTSMFIVYFSPLLWSKTTLIPSILGRTRTGLDPHMYKMKTMFLMSLAIIIAIFLQKISSDTSCGNFQTLAKFWNFPLHFLLQITTQRVKDIRKIVLILYIGGSALAPPI